MALSPQELHAELRGLLSFPVTTFNRENEIDLTRYREHLQYMMSENPDGLFVCGGTGEFFSLNLEEYFELVETAVDEVAGQLPVVAGVGYGTQLAIDFASAAEEAGADGIMVMPPYLINAEQKGLYQHYAAIAESTNLGMILYMRDNAIFAPDTVARLAEIPNIVGFKDGYGNMERLIRIRLAVGDELVMLNGMPTAEMSAEAFFGVGVTTYSSAVFNFVPEISRAFYEAISDGEDETVDKLMTDFYLPLVQLRDQVKGYAVSLVKAGLRARGMASAGPARSPLVNPTREHIAELKSIINQGLALVG